jgi:hypothetical protein
MEHLSLERLRGEGLRENGAASLGTLEDMLRKALITSFSLHRGSILIHSPTTHTV